MLDQSNQSTTITIGNTIINNTNLNQQINNHNKINNSSESSKDQFLNGLNLIERNLRYIFEQLNYIIKVRFQSSTTSLFAPTICFIITFVYFINLLSSPTISNDLDKEINEFHKTETTLTSTLTLVPGMIF